MNLRLAQPRRRGPVQQRRAAPARHAQPGTHLPDGGSTCLP